MPDTQLWRLLLHAAHDWTGEPPVDAMDQLDSSMREFADNLGFTLDRPTLEACLLGLAMVMSITAIFDGDDLSAEPTEDAVRASVIAAKYIVVKRLEALE
jgi:hypothetical protein